MAIHHAMVGAACVYREGSRLNRMMPVMSHARAIKAMITQDTPGLTKGFPMAAATPSNAMGTAKPICRRFWLIFDMSR